MFMFKKIIAFGLCGVMALGLVACGEKAPEVTEDPTVNETPSDTTKPDETKPVEVDLDSLDYDGWIAHLFASEVRISEVKITYTKVEEGTPRAEWIEGKDGEEGYWAISRRSGVLDDGTAIEEIDPTHEALFRSYKDANGVIYSHSSEIYPEDGSAQPQYIHVIEEKLYMRGMTFLAEYFATQNPEPEAPVLTDILFNEDTGRITVKVTGLYPDRMDGVIVHIYDENYNSLSVETFENIDGTYTLEFIDKGECVNIAVCSYYETESGDRIASTTSNVRMVPNKYYQDYVKAAQDAYNEMDHYVDENAVAPQQPDGEAESNN